MVDLVPFFTWLCVPPDSLLGAPGLPDWIVCGLRDCTLESEDSLLMGFATFLKVTMHSISSPAKTVDCVKFTETLTFDDRFIIHRLEVGSTFAVFLGRPCLPSLILAIPQDLQRGSSFEGL
jgi:hypothetical protein